MTADLERALWADACLAAQVFAHFIRAGTPEKAGLLLKAGAGPVRDAWMAHLKALLPSDLAMQQVPINISVERLLGGLDLGLTLAKGRAVEMRGVLASADKQVLFMPMASLADPTITALIAASMDSAAVRVERDGISKTLPTRFGILCFDESAPGEEGVSGVLEDRLMLHVDLRAVSLRAAQEVPALEAVPQSAPSVPEDIRRQLCELPVAFGLMSMRPTLQLIDLAKALCRLSGGVQVTEDHVNIAIRLGLVHRAQQLPAPRDEAQDQPEPEPEPQQADDPGGGTDDTPDQEASSSNQPPDDMTLEAAQASLPHGLLAYLKANRAAKARRSSSGRRGARSMGSKRGRPLASRKGALGAGKRLDLIATLRAAAPFQKVRGEKARAATGGANAPANDVKVHVRTSDFHIRRYQERSETSTIFVVDASGSTALNRLREAKGAIELLLAESYARRDYVSLVSFRGREAQVLLPPTRALVRAKRSLASLPGGGGTPLASGILQALTLAEEERKHGREPSIVILTDGSANVGISGQGGRKQAGDDAEKVARMVSFSGIPAILVDIGRQPQKKARRLSDLMDATYLPMPFAGSKELSSVVGASL